MAEETLVYRIPGAAWRLDLPLTTVENLGNYVQRHIWSKESVGQLYSANLQSDVIRVDAITKLQSTWSSHTRVRFDITAVNKERADHFQIGFHCLGFWHTHPEPVPIPSTEDIAMAADHALASREGFSGIILIIVGTAPLPNGLGVWVHDGTKLWKALPENLASLDTKEI